MLPPVRRRIDGEIAKISADMVKSVAGRTEHMQYFTTLPMLGLSKEELLMQIDNYLALSEFKWRDGHVSGAVYNYDTELCALVGAIYEKTAYTNPLHSDVFPGLNKMEAEVVRMCSTMFNGDANTVGTVRNLSQFVSNTFEFNGDFYLLYTPIRTDDIGWYGIPNYGM